MKDYFRIILSLLSILHFKTYGQTPNIVGTWCLNHDISKIERTDTLILSEADFFQCSPLKFADNGRIMVCSNMKPVKELKARTMECVWRKIGTWSFNLDTLKIKTDTFTLTLYLIPVSNNGLKFIVRDAETSIFKIICKTNDIPGDVDSLEISKLTEPLKALAALYSAVGGTMCDGTNCELTTALGLGKQGSEQHKSLMRKYFPNDKIAELVLKQDCYQRPSGASSFTDYEYLTIINLGDTVKVSYNLFGYSRGETSGTRGTDIYLYKENTFTKVKRSIWKEVDNSIIH